MITTILAQSHSMPQSNDLAASRNANAAGAPLPLIPRRAHSASRSGNTPYNRTSVPRSNTSINTISRACCSEVQTIQHLLVASDSAPSGAGKAAISIHINGQVGHRPSSNLSEQEVPSRFSSTSTVADRQSTLGVHLGNAGSVSRIHIQGQTNTRQVSKPDGPPSPACHNHPTQSRLIRKKSGQLVKSSLKSSTSCSKDGLSVTVVGSSSKSAPTTPTLAKVVHFDPQLERVKLFLAKQKPLAVSRDGSPTDDTSGTESDFPSFIYGHSSERKSRKTLSVRVNNMPPLVDKSADIALEDLSVSSEGSSIIGRVRLRNIAYTKCLTTRFTFDDWLTTSEVLGRYLETINAAFDRFTFVIRLHDVERKKLIFALRYAVAGKEIWDNNKGQNYIATFPQQADVEEVGTSRGISALRSKLENAIECEEGHNFQRNRALPGHLDNDSTATLSASASLGQRYDFQRSFKNPWTHVAEPQTLFDRDSFTKADLISWPRFPKENITTVESIPILGSPRELDADTFRPTVHNASSAEQTSFSDPACSGRNHQRGYFDANWEMSHVKLTPPRTTRTPQKKLGDVTSVQGTAFYSFTEDTGRGGSASGLGFFDNGLLSQKYQKGDSGSGDPTPLMVMSSSSRSATIYPYAKKKAAMDMAAGKTDARLNHSPTTNYRQFLSSFCFFNGSGNIQGALEEAVSSVQCPTGVSTTLTSPRTREYVLSMENMQVQSPGTNGLAVTRATPLH